MQQTLEKNCNNCLHRFVPCDGSPCCDCQEPHGGSPTHWQQGGSIPPLSVELGKPVQSRPSWERYFMGMARHVATRGTCDRKRVGCVITTGKRVVATGYNGSLPGTPHCDDVGHFMIEGHCERAVHAEQNAVCQSARHGVKLEGATAYVTCAPCPHCFKTLVAAGVTRIVYGEPYRNDRLIEEAREAGVVVEELSE